MKYRFSNSLLTKFALKRNRIMKKRKYSILNIAFLILSLSGLATCLQAQNNAGGSFLKIIPGARQQAISGTLTGAIDHPYSIFANPGATGVMRAWSLSASYTRLVPGIHNSTLLLNKGISLPWSRRARFAFGLTHLAIKDFDSSNGRAEVANGGDIVGFGSYGQPVFKGLSVGTSAKLIKTRLDAFDATTFAMDFGVLYRLPRIRFGGNTFAILSLGAAITQVGSQLQLGDTRTPLPQTVRGGAALNLGSHKGLQFHFGADYRKPQDEEGFISLGGELSMRLLNHPIAFRSGYSLEENNLLGQYTFGIRFGFNDLSPSLSPGRNKAIQMDQAFILEPEFFGPPTLVSANHNPIGPESFSPLHPKNNAVISTVDVHLKWQESPDPDIFDTVQYILFLDTDKAKVQTAMAAVRAFSRLAPAQVEKLPSTMVRQTNLTTPHYRSNDFSDLLKDKNCKQVFYWSVVAYDGDGHYQIMEKDSESIFDFQLRLLPDLTIKITSYEPETCKAELTIFNNGHCTAPNVEAVWHTTNPDAGEALGPITLPAGQSEVFTVFLKKSAAGEQMLIAQIDPQNALTETDESNNEDSRSVQCIGKPDLTIEKTAPKNIYSFHEKIEYTLSVKNHGNVTAEGIIVDDYLPENVDFISPSATVVSMDSSHLQWKINSLAPGESIEFNYTVTVTPPVLENVELGGIRFNPGSSALSSTAKANLHNLAEKLKNFVEQAPLSLFQVGGHASDSDSETQNRQLSMRRAQVVVDFLNQQGLDPQIFATIGFGKSMTADAVNAGQRNSKNNLVEIKLCNAYNPDRNLVNRCQISGVSPSFISKGTDSLQINIYGDAPKLSFTNVTFEFDKDVLTRESKRKLDGMLCDLFGFIAVDTAARYEIAGHTDNRGAASYNKNLSQRRAESVRRYLISRNPIFEVLIAKGYGEEQPVYCNDTGRNRRLNRRVELRKNGRVYGNRNPMTAAQKARCRNR